MPPLSIVIKPASGACNLSCRYCFHADEMSLRKVAPYGIMEESTFWWGFPWMGRKSCTTDTDWIRRAKGPITVSFTQLSCWKSTVWNSASSQW